jgi:hypothetical protein
MPKSAIKRRKREEMDYGDSYEEGYRLGRQARYAKYTKRDYKSWLKARGLLKRFQKDDGFHDGFLDGLTGTKRFES